MAWFGFLCSSKSIHYVFWEIDYKVFIEAQPSWITIAVIFRPIYFFFTAAFYHFPKDFYFQNIWKDLIKSYEFWLMSFFIVHIVGWLTEFFEKFPLSDPGCCPIKFWPRSLTGSIFGHNLDFVKHTHCFRENNYSWIPWQEFERFSYNSVILARNSTLLRQEARIIDCPKVKSQFENNPTADSVVVVLITYNRCHIWRLQRANQIVIWILAWIFRVPTIRFVRNKQNCFQKSK